MLNNAIDSQAYKSVMQTRNTNFFSSSFWTSLKFRAIRRRHLSDPIPTNMSTSNVTMTLSKKLFKFEIHSPSMTVSDNKMFVLHSSDIHRTLIGHSSDTPPTLLLHSSYTHPTLIGHSSDTHRTLIGHSADTHRTLIGHSSDTHRTLIGHSSDIEEGMST